MSAPPAHALDLLVYLGLRSTHFCVADSHCVPLQFAAETEA